MTIGGGPSWSFGCWAEPGRVRQAAMTARLKTILRKYSPPGFGVASTLIQTGGCAKKIAPEGIRAGIGRGGKLSSRLLPNGRILTSKEWSEAAVCVPCWRFEDEDSDGESESSVSGSVCVGIGHGAWCANHEHDNYDA